MGMDEVVLLLADVQTRTTADILARFIGRAHRPGTQGVLMGKWWFRVDISACGRRRTLTILQKIVDNDWETSQKNATVEYVNSAK